MMKDYAENAVDMQPAMLSILERIQSATVRAEMCAKHSIDNGDRVFGSVPTLSAGSGGKTAIKQDGSLFAVRDALDELHAALTEMEDAANRFNTL